MLTAQDVLDGVQHENCCGDAGAAQYASDTVNAAKRTAGQVVGGAAQTAKDTATGTVNYAADTAADARVRSSASACGADNVCAASENKTSYASVFILALLMNCVLLLIRAGYAIHSLWLEGCAPPSSPLDLLSLPFLFPLPSPLSAQRLHRACYVSLQLSTSFQIKRFMRWPLRIVPAEATHVHVYIFF